ncbi:epoxide hydrolase-like protein [Aaosphaeria arxii CBS 175.79]|uniref:Epoxide hydrolase-like protein n=1 Tax=Aaosphaeria arxii CBS 175.79 TaxID=1450172 RepID=A0A6A5XWZ8_9PLEO|nr:epoxide hydrolase-like protein [Aaosphaeria arxii CBS 175.79]KAF2017865.1 epoxide hydrolase-like protein [Aaosphaeria arxii CBS 175.79]
MSYSPPDSIKPFTLDIPEQELTELKQLLQLSRIGPKTYESTQTAHDFGVTHQWMTETKDYWLNKYDWRAQEKYINSFPNYTTEIEGLTVHFVALFSEKKDAIPILFLHGWPGSFIEFLSLVSLVQEKYPATDRPYHIIIPSLPGYTLSSGGPPDKDWTMQDSARVINTLMHNLGFDKYIAQGGDIGSFEAQLLAAEYDSCVAIHINMLSTQHTPEESEIQPYQKKGIEKALQWRERGSAYGLEHASRPSTIGFVLNSNPISLLAWIGEKLLEWHDETPPLDTVLTNISLYWFTHGFPRSVYPYRQIFTARDRIELPYIAKPFGFSYFPFELFPLVEVAVREKGNLVQYRQHEKGGHFAALERPREVWGDVEDFVKLVWGK